MKRFLFALALLSFGLMITGCGWFSNLDTDGGISRTELLKAHNHERSKHHETKLEYDEELTQRAQKWAEWMASHDSMVHSHLQGTSQLGWVAENIAEGYPDINAVMNGWMNSSGHRANILNARYTRAGFGWARRKPDGVPYWCAQFGGN